MAFAKSTRSPVSSNGPSTFRRTKSSSLVQGCFGVVDCIRHGDCKDATTLTSPFLISSFESGERGDRHLPQEFRDRASKRVSRERRMRQQILKPSLRLRRADPQTVHLDVRDCAATGDSFQAANDDARLWFLRTSLIRPNLTSLQAVEFSDRFSHLTYPLIGA